MVRGEADAAVHSAKDLPASPDAGAARTGAGRLPGAGRPPRRAGRRPARLPRPPGPWWPPGSARRRVQLANLRPDLTFTGLRGNLATRLAAVGQRGGGCRGGGQGGPRPAGVDPTPRPRRRGAGAVGDAPPGRPGGAGRRVPGRRRAPPGPPWPPSTIPAPGPLVTAERAFLAELGGGCTLPVGAHAVWVETTPSATVPDGRSDWTGMLASDDGAVVLRHTRRGHRPRASGPGCGPVPAGRRRRGDLGDLDPVRRSRRGGAGGGDMTVALVGAGPGTPDCSPCGAPSCWAGPTWSSTTG